MVLVELDSGYFQPEIKNEIFLGAEHFDTLIAQRILTLMLTVLINANPQVSLISSSLKIKNEI